MTSNDDGDWATGHHGVSLHPSILIVEPPRPLQRSYQPLLKELFDELPLLSEPLPQMPQCDPLLYPSEQTLPTIAPPRILDVQRVRWWDDPAFPL